MTRATATAITCCTAVLLLLGAAGCKRDIYAVNEANPFYQKGLEQRQAGRYEAAAEQFRACVHYSPESYKAHLQLAVLYGDHLDDLYRAIAHYRLCIQYATDDAAIRTQAQAGLERAQKRLYDELAPSFAPARPAIHRPLVAADEGPGSLAAAPPAVPVPAPVAVAPAPAVPVPAPVAVAPAPAITPVAPAAPDPAVTPVDPAPEIATPAPPDRSAFLRSRILATHTVATGETLSAISKRYYGDSSKWRIIYEANRDTLSAPEKLSVGQKIRIPVVDSQP